MVCPAHAIIYHWGVQAESIFTAEIYSASRQDDFLNHIASRLVDVRQKSADVACIRRLSNAEKDRLRLRIEALSGYDLETFIAGVQEIPIAHFEAYLCHISSESNPAHSPTCHADQIEPMKINFKGTPPSLYDSIVLRDRLLMLPAEIRDMILDELFKAVFTPGEIILKPKLRLFPKEFSNVRLRWGAMSRTLASTDTVISRDPECFADDYLIAEMALTYRAIDDVRFDRYKEYIGHTISL